MTTADDPVTGWPDAWPPPDPAYQRVLDDLLASGGWAAYDGPHGDVLRMRLGELCGVAEVRLCASGTAAVDLCLQAAQVRPGREVILAAYDFKANFVSTLAAGGLPILVDCRPGLPVPDPDAVRDAVSENTAAVIVSHLHGCLPDLSEYRAAAESVGAVLIEDACQVPGARLDGQPAGSMGHIAALSFGGSKLLTAGRGGAVVSSDPHLMQRIRLYAQRGNDLSPLSELQAALLLPQLDRLEERNQCRLETVRLVTRFLQQTPQFKLQSVLYCGDQPEAGDGRDKLTAYYKLPLLLQEDTADTRDDVIRQLRKFGLPVAAGFPALHRIHSRRRFQAKSDLTNADYLHRALIKLHHTPLLHSASVMQRWQAAAESL